MARLLPEYPPEPYVAEAEFALAQQVFAKGARCGRRSEAAAGEDQPRGPGLAARGG